MLWILWITLTTLGTLTDPQGVIDRSTHTARRPPTAVRTKLSRALGMALKHRSPTAGPEDQILRGKRCGQLEKRRPPAAGPRERPPKDVPGVPLGEPGGAGGLDPARISVIRSRSGGWRLDWRWTRAGRTD
jgi:hypothetical protein